MKKLALFVLVILMLFISINTFATEKIMSTGIYSKENLTTVCCVLLNENAEIQAIDFNFIQSELVNGEINNSLKEDKVIKNAADSFMNYCLGKKIDDIFNVIVPENKEYQNLSKDIDILPLLQALKNSVGF